MNPYTTLHTRKAVLRTIRAHDGTRILIRSLGQSCCAAPGISIVVDGAHGKRRGKGTSSGQWCRTAIFRQPVLLSHFRQASAVTRGRPRFWVQFTDVITDSTADTSSSRPYFRSLPCARMSIHGPKCLWCDLAVDEGLQGLSCADWRRAERSGGVCPESTSSHHATYSRSVRSYPMYLSLQTAVTDSNASLGIWPSSTPIWGGWRSLGE